MSTWTNKQHPEWFTQYNENVVDLVAYKAEKAKHSIKKYLQIFGTKPVGQLTGILIEVHPEEKF